jgi:hypothetical protein
MNIPAFGDVVSGAFTVALADHRKITAMKPGNSDWLPDFNGK